MGAERRNGEAGRGMFGNVADQSGWTAQFLGVFKSTYHICCGVCFTCATKLLLVFRFTHLCFHKKLTIVTNIRLIKWQILFKTAQYWWKLEFTATCSMLFKIYNFRPCVKLKACETNLALVYNLSFPKGKTLNVNFVSVLFSWQLVNFKPRRLTLNFSVIFVFSGKSNRELNWIIFFFILFVF